MAAAQRQGRPTRRRSSESGSASAARLRIHCLGTFRVTWKGESVDGFESQKVRALFAYLACQREQPLTRDHLAAVFWPEKDEESARRNLRQSLYNLRGLFPRDQSPIAATRHRIGLDSTVGAWVDACVFEDTLDTAERGDRLDINRLTEAVSLYRGDFLAGFQVKDSEEFDHWLAAQQERLREKVVAALQLLIDGYVERGEYRPGIQYAQRLVAIDPLSEDAHQKLMRLYALSGRRNRALAQYEELSRTLERELDVEPLEETTALQQRILSQEATFPNREASGEDVGPVIPMAGRGQEYDRLHACMEAAFAGEALVTVLVGEAGVGKTRLIRSLLDAATSFPDTLILKGSCLDVLPESFQPLAGALRGVIAEPLVAAGLRRRMDRATLADVSLIVPQLAALGDERTDKSSTATPQTQRRRLFEALERFLATLCGDAQSPVRRLVLLLDDLERADPATLDLLSHLLPRLHSYPIWVVGAWKGDTGEPDGSIARLLEELGDAHVLRLERLDRHAVYEVAAALVPLHQAEELSQFLYRGSQGLPHALAECINLLRDRGRLLPVEGRWSLAETSLAELELRPRDLRGLIGERFLQLPYSTRRLASLAAIAGCRFEAGLIAEASDEHPAVCDIGFDIMLHRWLIRRSSARWQHRQPDGVKCQEDPEETVFEFSSESIWATVYDHIRASRRRVLHRQIGKTLEHGAGSERLAVCELLAHHFRAARLHEEARAYLLAAAAKAERCGAIETALLYYRLADEETGFLLRSLDGQERARVERERQRLRDFQDRLEPAALAATP